MLLMSKACYDPAQAMTFWERDALEHPVKETQSEETRLNTHPTSTERIKNLREFHHEAVLISEKVKDRCHHHKHNKPINHPYNIINASVNIKAQIDETLTYFFEQKK